MKDKLSELSIPVNYILNHQSNEVKYFINHAECDGTTATKMEQ